MTLSPRTARPAGSARAGAVLALVFCFLFLVDSAPAPSSVPAPPTKDTGLLPTEHVALPATWAELWLVPEPTGASRETASPLADAFKRLKEGDNTGALAVAAGTEGKGGLAAYAHLTAARALQALGRMPEAAQRYERAAAAAGESAARLGAILGQAETAESMGDASRALGHFETLSRLKLAQPDLALAGVVRTATTLGDTARAQQAALSLYYDFATSPYASQAAGLVAQARVAARPDGVADEVARELARAERLFEARRYADARSAYVALQPLVTGDDAERIRVRSAACDFFTERYRAAADALAPLIDEEPYAAEARYYHLRSLRALGARDQYVDLVWQLSEKHPESAWSAEALNHLASFFIIDNQDDEALRVFARVLENHPGHRHAERAAWKLGWGYYRQGRLAEAADVFERGVRNAPRSDYRPSWLYWSGRAREQAGDRATAIARYRVAVADYQNSYYGRLAAGDLARLKEPVAVVVGVPGAAAGARSAAPRTHPAEHVALVRTLLSARLFDYAAAEVEFAQRTWGNSPALEATLAWIYNQRGELRRGITAMRRAYPQFIAAGGEHLPLAVQQVIFPVAYGGLIDRYARQRDLDPFLVAALVAQESTFQADARSVADAIGLMQILPSTGRRLAQAEGVRRFNATSLTQPEFNVRLGTRYFAGLVNDLGGEHLALASYNAGKSRVDRWLSEKPDLTQAEFIDDIPFPETQNYVKRILGTAEDYRRLYGTHGLASAASAPQPRTSAVAAARRPAPSASSRSKGTAPAKASAPKKKSTASKSKAAAASKTKAKKPAPAKKSTRPRG